MSEVLDGGAAPVAGNAGERPFLLERHFYDAGLHVEPIGHGRARPAWVPPQDWVGFRNDVPLGAGEHAVEFVRFRYRERAVTWIGLFRRAVDAVYGDRQNHEGVGVWMLDRDLLHGNALLQGLRTFSEQSGGQSGGALDREADRFLDAFLPDLVTPHLALPAPLGGWSLARGQVTETAIFAATAPNEAAAWSLAAKQLLRATVLAGPSPTHSRCVILVRVADPGAGDGGLETVSRGLSTEIVEAMPQALAAGEDAHRATAGQAQALAERLQASQGELERERERGAQLAAQVASLQSEVATLQDALDDSDPERIWSTIRGQLHEISGQIERTDGSVNNARREILDRLRVPAAQWSRPNEHGWPESSEAARRAPAATQHGTAGSSRDQTVFWAVVAGMSLLILVLGYLTYTRVFAPSPSAPQEAITAPADNDPF